MAHPLEAAANDFNPRPREGGDTGKAGHRGNTSDFNPRPREGGDLPCCCRRSSAPALFQSTPPRGGRLQIVRGLPQLRHFNPRPREGGDARIAAYPSDTGNFNPRPREGGDSKDAQFYLRIFDKQVELLRFLGKIRGGCLRNPEKDRRFLGKSLANLPAISGHLDFAGGREGASRIPVRRTTATPGGVCQRIRGSSGR